MDIKKTLDEKISKIPDDVLIESIKNMEPLYKEAQKRIYKSTKDTIIIVTFDGYKSEIKKRGLNYE